jgi:DNA-binding ferritin-like protein
MTTQEQERRLMELTGQQPANIILPEQRTQQAPQQEKPGFLMTAQDKVEENADRIRRNRIQQAVQSGDYATAEQLSGITLPRVNAPRSTVNFSERKRQLDAMPLGQLEQVGQQTLTAMQDAGVPVNEDLARDLTAGNTSAIAHAEKKMAEATVAKNAQVETASNGGGGQSVQKKVADFRKKANAVVKQYSDGKIE